MNNEPVAWVEEDNINMNGYEFDFQFVAFNRKPKSEADWVPLYTHSCKDLTDEEYAGIGLHLFRIGEATSIKDGIRLVKLIVELTNIRKEKEK